MKSCLKDKEIYSTHIQGKFIVDERLIKICKYMTLISKNVYINKLNHIVNKYTYPRTIK